MQDELFVVLDPLGRRQRRLTKPIKFLEPGNLSHVSTFSFFFLLRPPVERYKRGKH
jgi:hypothetical protein